MMNFTPSVILAGGKAGEHVTGYTGLGMADFDHVPPDDLERCFRLLDADPYVVLAYATISGEGVRVVYFTDVTESRFSQRRFSARQHVLRAAAGCKYDAQCSNIARTSILCYCPGLFTIRRRKPCTSSLLRKQKAQDALPAKKRDVRQDVTLLRWKKRNSPSLSIWMLKARCTPKGITTNMYPRQST